MVLVHDKSLPRGFWKLAKVQQVIGQEGQIRGAVLRALSSIHQLSM